MPPLLMEWCCYRATYVTHKYHVSMASVKPSRLPPVVPPTVSSVVLSHILTHPLTTHVHPLWFHLDPGPTFLRQIHFSPAPFLVYHLLCHLLLPPIFLPTHSLPMYTHFGPILILVQHSCASFTSAQPLRWYATTVPSSYPTTSYPPTLPRTIHVTIHLPKHLPNQTTTIVDPFFKASNFLQLSSFLQLFGLS